MSWWQRKIVALLYGLSDKALGMPGHEEWSSALVQRGLRGLPEVAASEVAAADWERDARRAHEVVTAANRLNFPKGLQAQGDRLLHPLSGEEAELPGVGIGEGACAVLEEVVGALSERTDDPKKRFLLLWRCLEEELLRRSPDVPWNLLPADTRIPDHGLLSHARVASAFVNCLPRPASLLFSIGPVQGFIASARKTRDLWMGSFLLSYLSWCAIRVIADELGPDHIIYPALLGHPLVDRWLLSIFGEKVPISRPNGERLRQATLPNRFFAVVPAERGEEVVKRAQVAVVEAWGKLAGKVWNELCRNLQDCVRTEAIWKRQVHQFPEIHYAVYPWEEDAEGIANRYLELTEDAWWHEWIRRTQGAYVHNQGSLYAACYYLTERALGARKASRLFRERVEPGGKCSVCGERQCLAYLDEQGTVRGQSGEREFWSEVASKFPADVEAGGRERLCAICTVKRFAPKWVFGEELEAWRTFPSTDSIAAAPFVTGILQRWRETRDSVRKFVECVKTHGAWARVAFGGMGIPKVEALAQGKEGAEELVRLDGEWLFVESYEPARVWRAHRIKVKEEEVRRVRELLRQLYELGNGAPTDYYAVLFMDGDGMGRWLSGTHARLPRFSELVHPELRRVLEGEPNWRDALQSRRLVSPSFHAFISEALASFALNFVPHVVERIHAGRLVYSGGDDVLALLPVEDALSTARALRALFSGEARFQDDGNVQVEFGSADRKGWMEWQRWKRPTMGKRATASVGIVIAHRLHPLRDVLQQGREAEEDAKERYGRNAICVRWLKRSGEHVQMGAQFFYAHQQIPDTLGLLLELAEVMRSKISRGLATDWMQASFALVAADREMQEAELRRLLLRRRVDKAGLPDEEVEGWARRLAFLAEALDMHADRDADPSELTRPQRGAVELAKWLTFLRFWTGGGH